MKERAILGTFNSCGNMPYRIYLSSCKIYFIFTHIKHARRHNCCYSGSLYDLSSWNLWIHPYNTIGSTETFTGSGVVEKTYIETATYCGNRSPNAARRYFHTILQYGEIYCDVDSEEIYRTLEDAKGKTVDLEIRKDTLKNGDHKYYVLSVNGIECFGEQIEKEDIP